VLMLTGQVESSFYGKGRGYLHEAENQMAMLGSLTRQSWSVRQAGDIAAMVVAAGHEARSGRPQPTAVEIPVDLQYARIPIGPITVPEPHRQAPAADRLRQAADLLTTARRPLVWAGGGVLHAGAADELRSLVERLGIAVVTSTEGRGALPEDHPLCLGAFPAAEPLREVVERADVVLAVGTRFQMYPTDFWRLRLPRLIHLDVDPAVIGRSYPAEVALVADARTGLTALDKSVEATQAEPGWAGELRAASGRTREQSLARLGPDHRGIVEAIRRHLPRDGAVVRDSTVPAYAWGDSLLPILEPGTSMRPVSSAIGPGLPLALGAAAGTGKRAVVIHGDGGIMLTIGELATLAQFDLPVTVCVFNDRGYGVLRGIEAATFGTQFDVDLATPDFVGLAESMGVPAEKVADAAGFEQAFVRAGARTGPGLIEIDLTALVPMDYPIGGHENVG
jgi:acetolactate synthase-1/2/3 large subunit